MKKLFLGCLLLQPLFCFSQAVFIKGYFIDNDHHRKDCLIEDVYSKNNIAGFDYKLTEDAAPLKASIDNVEEFGFQDNFKWIRATVNVDTSSRNIDVMKNNRHPEWKQRTVFLKTLIEGKASLYEYKEGDFEFFFFSKDNGNLEQLVYKKFHAGGGKYAYNSFYIAQLQSTVNCSINALQKITAKYNANDLIAFFKAYNECENSPMVSYQAKRKVKISIRATPGINISSYRLGSTQFETKATFRAGVDFEALLPTKRNHWAIFIEPVYHYYKSDASNSTTSGSVDYKSIQMSLGLRYYLPVTKKLKVYGNAAFLYDFPIDSEISYKNSTVKIHTIGSYFAGVGGTLKKVSFEYRIYSKLTLAEGEIYESEQFSNQAFILGYKF